MGGLETKARPRGKERFVPFLPPVRGVEHVRRNKCAKTNADTRLTGAHYGISMHHLMLYISFQEIDFVHSLLHDGYCGGPSECKRLAKLALFKAPKSVCILFQLPLNFHFLHSTHSPSFPACLPLST
jgi:hypothetical protein